jgi:hypothetical protein
MATRPTAFVRWLAAPVTAAITALGVWVAGGVITNDFRSSMAFTAIWFALAFGACIVIARRRRFLAAPVLVGFFVAAVALGAYLGWNTLHDRVADEEVVTGVPMAAAPERDANVELSSGAFESLEHASRGRAAVVRLADGKRMLTFTDFETSAGPDLRVRLVVGDSSDGDSPGALDLGALKGNKGNQQYEIPPDADLGRYESVVVWCRAFSVGFAQALLEQS